MKIQRKEKFSGNHFRAERTDLDFALRLAAQESLDLSDFARLAARKKRNFAKLAKRPGSRSAHSRSDSLHSTEHRAHENSARAECPPAILQGFVARRRDFARSSEYLPHSAENFARCSAQPPRRP